VEGSTVSVLRTWPEPAETVPADTGDDEATLVARARLDPAAFGPLYARYLGPVYRYCYARLGSREAVEDASSLVFMRALAALPRFQDGNFRAWLFTIVHNVVANSVRSARPRGSLAEAVDVADQAPTPEEAALAAEEGRTIRDLLAQLPPDQRRVVELRLAGLDGVEIGAVLGRSRGAVDAAQHRAVTRLRLLLGVPARPAKERSSDG
jgi:RNA polymerase sigma-70 factor (ECF subfamily)